MCSRRLSLNRVLPSDKVGLYRNRVITTGSPVASLVSGPAVACTNAMRVPSGDHAIVLPVSVSALLLVPSTSARCIGEDPSPRATIRPALVPVRPMYASDLPSGDQTGDEPRLCSSPTLVLRPPATSRIQSCVYGRPGPSLCCTV